MLGVLVLVGRGLPRGGGGGGGGWYPAPMALSRAVLFVWSTLKCGQRDVAPKTVKVIDLSPKSIVFTVILYYFCSGKVCEVFQHKDKVQHQRTQWEEQGEKDKYVMCREI